MANDDYGNGKLISVKNIDGLYKNYAVHDDVYVYVKRLEYFVNNPRRSTLKEDYMDRFRGQSKILSFVYLWKNFWELIWMLIILKNEKNSAGKPGRRKVLCD